MSAYLGTLENMVLGFFVSLAKWTHVVDLLFLVVLFLFVNLVETSLCWSPSMYAFEYVYSFFRCFVFAKECVVCVPVYAIESGCLPIVFFL